MTQRQLGSNRTKRVDSLGDESCSESAQAHSGRPSSNVACQGKRSAVTRRGEHHDDSCDTQDPNQYTRNWSDMSAD